MIIAEDEAMSRDDTVEIDAAIGPMMATPASQGGSVCAMACAMERPRPKLPSRVRAASAREKRSKICRSACGESASPSFETDRRQRFFPQRDRRTATVPPEAYFRALSR